MELIIRDVPDIRFRLAGYPAIFSNPRSGQHGTRYRISQPDSAQSFLCLQSVSSALQEESLLNIEHNCCLIMQKGLSF